MQELIEEEVSEGKGFRLYAKNLFLTYSRVPNYWNLLYVKEHLMDRLMCKKGSDKGKVRVRAYIIGEETHKDPIGEGEYERGDKHYHCLVELSVRLNIRSPNALDIDGVHGNYQSVKDVPAVLAYVKKGGKYIGEGYPGLSLRARSVLEAPTEEDARLMLMDKMSPSEQIRLRNDIVTLKKKRTVVDEIVMRAPLYEFQRALMPFPKGAGFNEKGRPKGVIFYGEAGSGKTTTAYRVAADTEQDVMVVRDLKEMSQHYNKENIILFDEMTKEVFEESQRELALYVTDPQAKTAAYYGTKPIVWPRKIIIATNEDIKNWRFNEATRSRFLMARVYADGRYQYQIFKGNKIVDITREEVRKEMGLDEKD